jgi:hypothetical protein
MDPPSSGTSDLDLHLDFGLDPDDCKTNTQNSGVVTYVVESVVNLT